MGTVVVNRSNGPDAVPKRQAPTTVSSDTAQSALRRVLASASFKSSGRHRDFLAYIVQETLNGRSEELKEYSIGVAVLHRGAGFDPRVDTIVRTEARRLRSRLSKYYANEGISDPIRIELVRGSYIPVFRTAGDADRYPASASAVSIAVLPFMSMSIEPEGEVFAEGLAEELISALARVPGVQVVARTSAFQFRGQHTNIQEIGRRLNVRTVLEGAVRKAGKNINLTVRLVDCGNERVLWAETYDREMSDMLTLERELCRAILTALGARSFGEHRESLLQSLSQPPRGVDPDAYLDYLRGRYSLGRMTPTSIHAAIDYMHSATARDPQFAAAHAALAHCFAVVPMFTDTPGAEVIPQIRSSASKALELDPNSSEAHRSLGFAYIYDYDWANAYRELQRALELSPGEAAAHNAYARFLVRTGKLEEALNEHRAALALDPASPVSIQAVGRALTYLHRFEAAAEQLREALAVDPDSGPTHEFLGLTYVFRHLYAEGIKELETACRILGTAPGPLGHLGYAYAISGDQQRAHEVLNEIMGRAEPRRALATGIASIHIGLGDYDRAFDWLCQAADHQDGGLLLQANPIYDPLRADARYLDLLMRMRLRD